MTTFERRQETTEQVLVVLLLLRLWFLWLWWKTKNRNWWGEVGRYCWHW